MAAERADTPLFAVDGLNVDLAGPDGYAKAVDGVGFCIRPGEAIALVGEAGSGNSVTVLSILGLVPRPVARVRGRGIAVDGRDPLRLPPHALRRVRGRDLAMVFQEPRTSRNPVLTVAEQTAEAARLHLNERPRHALTRAVAMLGRIGMPEPGRVARSYPFQLSGGMRQRAMIAMALACGPRLLVADEPTTALDVTTQAQTLDPLRDLRREFGQASSFITHDLGVVAEIAGRVLVRRGRRRSRCIRPSPQDRPTASPAGSPPGTTTAPRSSSACIPMPSAS